MDISPASQPTRRDGGRTEGRTGLRTASFLTVLALACATSTPPPEQPERPARATAADVVYWLLAGRFDSADQARSVPGFTAVQVVACPAEVPGMDPRALYVEQARMDSPRAPYEQRVYVLEPLEPGGSVAMSHVFELADPAGAVGACERRGPPRFVREQLVERLGCALRFQAEGKVWRGSTSGRGCRSPLGGAAYVTDELTLDAAAVRSWERGFDATGVQTWGVDSTPLVFVRRTPLR